jgi:hypothetical protein
LGWIGSVAVVVADLEMSGAVIVGPAGPGVVAAESANYGAVVAYPGFDAELDGAASSVAAETVAEVFVAVGC